MPKPPLTPDQQVEFIKALFDLCDRFGVECFSRSSHQSLGSTYAIFELWVKESSEIHQEKTS